MTKRAADTLNAAADYLEAHELHKGSLTDFHGNVCALGAIRVAVSGEDLSGTMEDPAEYERFAEAADRLGQVLNVARCGIPKWNDAPHRTKADVVQALRDTADLEALDEGLPIEAPEPVATS